MNGYDFAIEIPEGETLQVNRDGCSHIQLSDPVSPDKQDDTDFLTDLIGWRVVGVKCGTIVLGNDKGNKIMVQKPLNIVTNDESITMSDF